MSGKLDRWRSRNTATPCTVYGVFSRFDTDEKATFDDLKGFPPLQYGFIYI